MVSLEINLFYVWNITLNQITILNFMIELLNIRINILGHEKLLSELLMCEYGFIKKT